MGRAVANNPDLAATCVLGLLKDRNTEGGKDSPLSSVVITKLLTDLASSVGQAVRWPFCPPSNFVIVLSRKNLMVDGSGRWKLGPREVVWKES